MDAMGEMLISSCAAGSRVMVTSGVWNPKKSSSGRIYAPGNRSISLAKT